MKFENLQLQNNTLDKTVNIVNLYGPQTNTNCIVLVVASNNRKILKHKGIRDIH